MLLSRRQITYRAKQAKLQGPRNPKGTRPDQPKYSTDPAAPERGRLVRWRQLLRQARLAARLGPKPER